MKIPDYDILEELGRGGMGVVYKARQVQLDRLVALKTIVSGPLATAEELARFRVEAKAAARLDHQNIIRIYDFGQHHGLPYFSMELVTGGALYHKMAGRPWPISTAANLIHVLAMAIHHAHLHNVVHRDLKPANVLFGHDGTPKISDFGLAKQLDSNLNLTDTGRILGTVRYMAPEQAIGDIRAIGPATDVHALGAIFYELLTGRPAFGGRTLLATLEQIRSSAVTPPSSLRPEMSAELESICLRCLHKHPAQRHATAEDLGRALQDFLKNTPHCEPLLSPLAPDVPADGADRNQWWRT